MGNCTSAGSTTKIINEEGEVIRVKRGKSPNSFRKRSLSNDSGDKGKQNPVENHEAEHQAVQRQEKFGMLVPQKSTSKNQIQRSKPNTDGVASHKTLKFKPVIASKSENIRPIVPKVQPSRSNQHVVFKPPEITNNPHTPAQQQKAKNTSSTTAVKSPKSSNHNLTKVNPSPSTPKMKNIRHSPSDHESSSQQKSLKPYTTSKTIPKPKVDKTSDSRKHPNNSNSTFSRLPDSSTPSVANHDSQPASQKKKLIVRGLKRYKETRRVSAPPLWLKEFPVKSRFHVDNYIYDFEVGPCTPTRNVAAMAACPKQSGRCDRCGIYCANICQSCRRCEVDCCCQMAQYQTLRNNYDQLNCKTNYGVPDDPTMPLDGILSQANKLLSDFHSQLPTQYPFNNTKPPPVNYQQHSMATNPFQSQFQFPCPPPPFHPSSMSMYHPYPNPYQNSFVYPSPYMPSPMNYIGVPYQYPQMPYCQPPYAMNPSPSNDFGMPHPTKPSVPPQPVYRQYVTTNEQHRQR